MTKPRQPDDFDRFKTKILRDPQVKAAYDELEDEFRLISMLIDLRREANLTQAQLAEKLGMKQAAIARLESGAANPSYKTLARVAKAFDKHLAFI